MSVSGSVNPEDTYTAKFAQACPDAVSFAVTAPMDASKQKSCTFHPKTERQNSQGPDYKVTWSMWAIFVAFVSFRVAVYCFFLFFNRKKGGFRRFNLTVRMGITKNNTWFFIQEFCWPSRCEYDLNWSVPEGSDVLGGCIQATPMPRVFGVLFGGKNPKYMNSQNFCEDPASLML